MRLSAGARAKRPPLVDLTTNTIPQGRKTLGGRMTEPPTASAGTFAGRRGRPLVSAEPAIGVGGRPWRRRSRRPSCRRGMAEPTTRPMQSAEPTIGVRGTAPGVGGVGPHRGLAGGADRGGWRGPQNRHCVWRSHAAYELGLGSGRRYDMALQQTRTHPMHTSHALADRRWMDECEDNELSPKVDPKSPQVPRT